MRLCVRCLRVCAGEEKRTLRKSALWGRALTEKRILGAGPHGKAHSGRPLACRLRFSVRWRVQSALFRESDTPRARLYVSRRVQSGALVYAVATQFAEASTHTNPRRAQLLRGYYTSSGLTAGRCGLQRRTRRQRPARSGTPRRSGPPSDPRSFGSWNSRNAPRRRGSPCSRPGRVRK